MLTIDAFCLYWIAIFTGTHLPSVGQIGESVNDKVMHFGAYGGFAFLAMTAWSVRRLERRTPGDSPTSLREFIQRFFAQSIPLLNYCVVAVLVSFWGTVDEVTQKPVGRTCDRYDWLADTCGAIAALCVFAVLHQLGKRRWGRP